MKNTLLLKNNATGQCFLETSMGEMPRFRYIGHGMGLIYCAVARVHYPL